MKICVVGAGAIGGYLAVRLAMAGEDVSVVARGACLAAIHSRGLKLVTGAKEEVAQVTATADMGELPPQGLVILGMKAHQVAAVAPPPPLKGLLHDNTTTDLFIRKITLNPSNTVARF